MELSVVIPTCGGLRRLSVTLGGLAAAIPPAGGLEVVIGDDGSPEAVPEDIGAGKPFAVRTLRWTPNRGRATACNRALAAAHGRVVLVLDDDMTIARDALAGHVAAHPPGSAPGAVIGRVDSDPGHFTGPFGRFRAEEEACRRARLAAAPRDLSFSDCLTGHFSIPRAAMLAAGGYDESFSRYGFEDLEVALRLAEHGVRLEYREDLVAVHRSETTDFRRHCRRHLESGAMAVVFAARHPDPRVRAFLRVDGMRLAEQKTPFLRLMAAAHGLVRRTPRPVRGLWPALGLALALLLERSGPRRLRHVAYHVVRDMYYARGIADSLAPPPHPESPRSWSR